MQAKTYKPRIRLRPGERFGRVVPVRPPANAWLVQCACGSTAFNLEATGFTIVCDRCSRLTDHVWTPGRNFTPPPSAA